MLALQALCPEALAEAVPALSAAESRRIVSAVPVGRLSSSAMRSMTCSSRGGAVAVKPSRM